VDSENRGFASIGAVANRLGVSTVMVRRYERAGIIPPGRRVDGSQARIWPLEEVVQMPARIAEQREKRKEAVTAA
jgi:DNA-binding transcriptional MerR regulator